MATSKTVVLCCEFWNQSMLELDFLRRTTEFLMVLIIDSTLFDA